jgi:hypothetical protein
MVGRVRLIAPLSKSDVGASTSTVGSNPTPSAKNISQKLDNILESVL